MRHTEWTTKMALDLALVLESGMGSVADFLEEHRLDPHELQEMLRDKLFSKAVEDYREDIRERGLSFKIKARVQAEELLRTSYLLTQDPDVPASVKADLIKSTVKWAGYDAPAQTGVDAGGGVSITINLGSSDDPKPKVVNITPTAPAVEHDEE